MDAADEAVRLSTAEAEAVRLDTAQAEAAVRAAEETVSLTPDEAVRLAAAVEHGSEHPLARAITAYGDTRRTALGDHRPLPAVRRFAATAGYGVTGEVDGRTVTVGRPGDLTELPAALADAVRTAEDAGHTAVLVTADGTPQAVVAVGDTLRPDCYRAVDHHAPPGPAAGAGHRGPGGYGPRGRRTPRHHGDPRGRAAGGEGRAGHHVEGAGRPWSAVVLVDGINDAAALAHADLGIAMGSGTDAAIGAADVTVLRDDLQAVPDAVRLARRTLGTIRANLVWAFGYNLVTVPLAAVGRLDPMIAAAAMSASSLLVVGNSLRLRAWRPGGRGTDRRTADGRKTAGRGAAGRRAFSIETSRESV
ncbi:Heavy metal translocating P-type ATPase OS=Streptomyces rimosus subsp. rimosus (strain ATCC / DSM 40260 / JCM 4667 / NRRL 2234) OX=1265868 GN=SRIM_012540 PE=3 SV=1 [Streptomyces rimosus subsp. rimosus]